jgi:hypothetical protein
MHGSRLCVRVGARACVLGAACSQPHPRLLRCTALACLVAARGTAWLRGCGRVCEARNDPPAPCAQPSPQWHSHACGPTRRARVVFCRDTVRRAPLAHTGPARVACRVRLPQHARVSPPAASHVAPGTARAEAAAAAAAVSGTLSTAQPQAQVAQVAQQQQHSSAISSAISSATSVRGFAAAAGGEPPKVVPNPLQQIVPPIIKGLGAAVEGECCPAWGGHPGRDAVQPRARVRACALQLRRRPRGVCCEHTHARTRTHTHTHTHTHTRARTCAPCVLVVCVPAGVKSGVSAVSKGLADGPATRAAIAFFADKVRVPCACCCRGLAGVWCAQQGEGGAGRVTRRCNRVRVALPGRAVTQPHHHPQPHATRRCC